MFQGVVLAVSEEQNIRDLLVQALSSHDVSVLVAGDAVQAIDILEEQRVAIVILDWLLVGNPDDGDNRGLAVLDHACRVQPEIIIIGLLGSDAADRGIPSALNADDYLVKPLSPDLVRWTIDRALELRRLKRAAERLALINGVGRRITSILDMNKLLWEIARLIREGFDCYYVAIALLEDGALEVKAAVGGDQDSLPPIGVRYFSPEDHNVMAQALLRREPLLVADLQDASQYTLLPELSQARSVLVMPIALQDQQLGALKVLSTEPGAFEDGDLPLFESLAAQIAVAVQNARLFAQRQKHEETLHSLNAAAVAMQRVITSQARVLEVMINELCRYSFVSLVHLKDPDSVSVNLVSSSLSPRLTRALNGLLDTSPDHWSLNLARAPAYQQVLDERRALFFEYVEPLINQVIPVALPPDKVDLVVQILGNPHAVIAPMFVGDQAIGWLTVLSAQITAEDRSAITAFANQAAVALENARLLAGARRADKLAMINEAGQAMARTLEFDEVLRLLLQEVSRSVKVDEGVVALWNEVRQCYVPRARLLEGRAFSDDAPISEISLPSVHIPLMGHNQAVGLLALDRRSDGKELSEDDLQLAQALTNQAASALENARLYGELKRSAEELECSQHRLIQSEKLIATGRLAASIAHEINNPLQAIKNCLELILDETEAGEPLDRTLLDVATNELERIRGIIQQMLGLYRPEQERMGPVDLNTVLEGVLALMGQQLESYHVVVETNLDPARPRVIGRGDQIRQVFINLILNAVEAMPEGGGITITTHQNKEGMVAIQVTDTGVGIAPEDLTRIADPFFTTKPKGLGLGLAICHEIVERHQGTLDVTSQVGRGTTFTVQLPAAG